MKNGSMATMPNKGPVTGLEISFIPSAKENLSIFEARQKCLSVFADQDGVLHHEFTPVGKTVNTEYYL